MTQDIVQEGMSSEELDKLTLGEEETVDDSAKATAEEEAALEAEEALKETEEAAAEDEADPKDAVIGEFRRKARDLEIEKARLEGELEARKALQTETKDEVAPEKSPLELAEEAWLEENGDMDGFAMSGQLYREQKAFDDAKVQRERETETAKTVETTMASTASELQAGELSPEAVGEGLDLKSMCALGDKYLDKWDNGKLADIQATKGTKAALTHAYKILKTRILEAGTEDTQTLQKAIAAKAKKDKEVSGKKNTETDIDALTTEDETVVTDDEDAPRVERLTNFIFS
jgi:hypothetical protein